MEWHGLSTREWATVFWVADLLVVGVLVPSFRSALAPLVKTLLGFWQLHVAVLVFVGWTALICYLGRQLGAWNPGLLKDTVAWFLFYGFIAMFSAPRALKEDRFFRRAALSALSVGALMQFLLNLHTFPFLVELVLQPLVTFLLLMQAVAGVESRTRRVKDLVGWLLAAVGLWVVIATAKGLWNSWRGIDPKQVGLAFALSIWLPLAMLPMVYVLALILGYDTTFRLTSFRNEGKKPPMSVKAAILFGLRGDLREVNDLPQHHMEYRAISRSRSFREALGHVRRYERTRERTIEASEIEAARLEWYAGDRGRRTDGTMLDQREFKETKRALRWIQTCHLGRYNDRGRYQKDLMAVVGDLTQQGLPPEHGVTMRVRKDGQAWYAWRRTLGGYVLGIGMDKGRDNEWLYEGWEPPSGFPGQDRAWGETPYETPPNWQ